MPLIVNKHSGPVSFPGVYEFAAGINDVPEATLALLETPATQEQNKVGYGAALDFYFKNGTLEFYERSEDDSAPKKRKPGRPRKESAPPPAPDALEPPSAA